MILTKFSINLIIIDKINNMLSAFLHHNKISISYFLVLTIPLIPPDIHQTHSTLTSIGELNMLGDF